MNEVEISADDIDYFDRPSASGPATSTTTEMIVTDPTANAQGQEVAASDVVYGDGEALQSALSDMLLKNRPATEIRAMIKEAGSSLSDADEASLDQYEAMRLRGERGNIQVRVLSPEETQAQADGGGGGAMGRGILDTVSMGGADEIGAAVGAGYDVLTGETGDQSYGDLYTAKRDRARALQAKDEKYWPGASTTGKILGGFLLPTSGARAGVTRVVGEGAAFGAAHGFGSGTDTESRLTGAATEGVTGAVIGLGAGLLGRYLGRPSATASEGREVLDAAGRLSRDGLTVTPTAADVGGGIVRRLDAANEQSLLASGPGREASRRYVEGAEVARDRAAQELLPIDPTTGRRPAVETLETTAARAGDTADPRSLANFEQQSKDAVSAQYDEAARLAGQSMLSTPRAIAALDAQIARLEAVPGEVAGLAALRQLRADLQGVHTVDGLRRLRTSWGDNLDSSQRTVRDAAKQLWGPLSDDITDGLTRLGRDDAAAAYRSADDAFRVRGDDLDIVESIVGPASARKSAEEISRNLQSMTRSDGRKLGRALDLMDPTEAANVRASILGELGRASDANQNVAQDAFSLPAFSTQWAKMSETAKAALFTGQTRRDIDDLVRLSTAAKAKGRYANSSNTSGATGAAQFLYQIFGNLGPGGIGFAAGGPGGGLAGVAGQYGIARILATPGAARALLRLAEGRPVRSTIRKLTEIASKTTGVSAQPIIALRDYLTQYDSENDGR